MPIVSIPMQVIADANYAGYRPEYRSQDRCPTSAVLSPSDDWIYPNYTVSPQALPSRAQLPSMYTAQRPPDQSYPSPSPSVPSPGPRASASLDYSSQSSPSTPPDTDYSSVRDSQLGPVRHPRTRQLSLSYKGHGRRDSGEFDATEGSRPQSPYDSYDPSRVILGAGLSLSIPAAGMDANSQMDSPYLPATPNSISSPHQTDYLSSNQLDGRPPSPAPSNRSSSGSGVGLPSHYSPMGYDPIPPSHGRVPQSRVKKHTKKKLDALEKKRICNYHKDHQNARQEDIAEMFGIERSTVSKILKHKSTWLQIDDNAEVQSKNRPSKFPALEEQMRKWLQDCVDRDVPITDSAIRKRALEISAGFHLTEEKFKASAGWIENFKHRHHIRGGKWTQVPKRISAIENPNPGLNGPSNPLGLPLLPQLQPPPPPSPSPSAYNLASITHPEDTEARDTSKYSREWLLPPQPQPQSQPRPTTAPKEQRSASPTAILKYHRSEPGQPADIEEIPFPDSEEPQPFAPPTAEEAEEALNTFMQFVRYAPEDLITHEQLTMLVSVKCALFQYQAGLPYNTTS